MATKFLFGLFFWGLCCFLCCTNANSSGRRTAVLDLNHVGANATCEDYHICNATGNVPKCIDACTKDFFSCSESQIRKNATAKTCPGTTLFSYNPLCPYCVLPNDCTANVCPTSAPASGVQDEPRTRSHNKPRPRNLADVFD